MVLWNFKLLSNAVENVGKDLHMNCVYLIGTGDRNTKPVSTETISRSTNAVKLQL